MIDIVDIKNATYLSFYIENGYIYCENTRTHERVIVEVIKEGNNANKT